MCVNICCSSVAQDVNKELLKVGKEFNSSHIPSISGGCHLRVTR